MAVDRASSVIMRMRTLLCMDMIIELEVHFDLVNVHLNSNEDYEGRGAARP